MSPRSHGDGCWTREQFASIGEGVVIEPGVLVFHPETIRIGNNVYIGHNTILKGYYKGPGMEIEDGVWVGQQCFFHSAGGLHIGKGVGVGPGVRILTSAHRETAPPTPIMEGELVFGAVRIEAGSDLGVSAVILPGVTIGPGTQVGAGAVVTRSMPGGCVVAGVPAVCSRERRQDTNP